MVDQMALVLMLVSIGFNLSYYLPSSAELAAEDIRDLGDARLLKSTVVSEAHGKSSSASQPPLARNESVWCVNTHSDSGRRRTY